AGRGGASTRPTTGRSSPSTRPARPAKASSKGKPDSRYKRGKFRKGVRDKVWDKEAAKSKDGVVRDPVTGRRMNKDEPWDMGHRPGMEHRKHVQSASRRNIDRKQFLDEYNDPSHYRPELPKSNRSHRGELKTDDYFGP
ncbi:HNH/ENDO VII family nuclease, partial [Bordetella petrii]|uniref:HNH/ENDO VII family nuclease n=1 Tax=Bordetella petrii TaxID=94624 RepID=UPI001E3762D2